MKIQLFNRLSLLFVLLLAFSCNTTKKVVYTPAGTWDYTVTDTPMGDQKGTFKLMQEGDAFSGVMISDQGETKMGNLSMEGNMMSSTFDAMGYSIDMKGTFEGDYFKGTVQVDGYEFPVTAVRKTQ